MERPTTNHFGRCSQMCVDGCHRPLDDTWCFFLPCRGIFVTSCWVFAVVWVIVVVCCCRLRLVSQQILLSSLMLPMGPSVQGLLIWICSGLMDNFFATNFILDLQKVPGLQ